MTLNATNVVHSLYICFWLTISNGYIDFFFSFISSIYNHDFVMVVIEAGIQGCEVTRPFCYEPLWTAFHSAAKHSRYCQKRAVVIVSCSAQKEELLTTVKYEFLAWRQPRVEGRGGVTEPLIEHCSWWTHLSRSKNPHTREKQATFTPGSVRCEFLNEFNTDEFFELMCSFGNKWTCYVYNESKT